MTSTFDSTGVTYDQYADILERLHTLAKARWGDSINLDEDGWPGGLYVDLAILLGEINEVNQGIYDGSSVSNSDGAQLGGLVELIGLEYQAASYSTVTLTLTASKATTVPAGSLYSTAAGVTFATDIALVFAGAGSSTVAATCTIVGVNNAAIGEVTVLTSSVSGITACTNVAAATPGREQETAAELKARHTIAVATSGDSDAASIYEAVSAVSGVSAAYIFDNDTDETASDGTPAHQIHVSAIGGTDADVATAIDNTKTASVGTYGATTESVYNSTTNQTKDINFDRAVATATHIKVTLNKIAGVYPDDGDDQIKAALVAHYEGIIINSNVVYTALYNPIYSVAGHTVTALTLDTVDPPVGVVDLVSTPLIRYTLALADIDIV
jgi:hypothetical protein